MIHLTCIAIDAARPPVLAEFYSELLRRRIQECSEEYAMVGDGHTTLCFGAVTGHTPPRWPATRAPQNASISTPPSTT